MPNTARTAAAPAPAFAQAHPGPNARACHRVVDALASLHGLPDRGVAAEARKDAHTCGEREEVLAALVATILSQHTTAKNAGEAMDSLWDRFDGDWAQMLAAGPEAIASAIRVGGLSNVKGRRIHTILQQVQARHRHLSLEHLRAQGDAEVRAELTSFAGVGPKTAACVALFSLGREDFAVDTHVLRIAKRLGWLPPKATREQAYKVLDARVPQALKYALHVLFVHHGKCCPECAASGRAQRPPEGPCPLTPLLPGARRPRAVAARRARAAAGSPQGH